MTSLRPHRALLPVLALTLLLALVPGARLPAYGDQPEDAVVIHDGLKIPYRYAAILTAPGQSEKFIFQTQTSQRSVTVLECIPQAGKCTVGDNDLVWAMPNDSGNIWLRVKLNFRSTTGKAYLDERDEWVLVAALVGYPGSMLQNGFINGFEIGEYPMPEKTKHPERYQTPAFFYYLDTDYLGLYLSEHIALGDVGYDGRAPFPQYFTLRIDLVKKLEAMQDELVRRGRPSRYHYIGGGFISPRSNIIRTSRDSAAASMSRHMWGEAIDFIIDEDPRDEIIDDMNQDGKIDVRDALYIRDLIHDLEAQGKCVPGGIGVYAPPKNSSIQLHVDVRGYPTDWGIKKFEGDFTTAPPKRSLRPGGN